MNARLIHALLAYGVNNPHLLSEWKHDRAVQLKLGIPDSLNFDALRQFAGLSTKVRHNGLRSEYPLTFRLMALAELEVEVFASYSEHNSRAGKRLAIGVRERAQNLIDYLGGWLDPGQRAHALLWDIVRHEHAIAELKDLLAISDRRPVQTRGDFPIEMASRPSIAGTLLLRELRSSPKAVEAALFEMPVQLQKVSIDNRYYAYWIPPEGMDIAVLELDALGYYCLSTIDGVRDITAISRLLSDGEDPLGGFVESFSQLATVGLIDIQSPVLPVRL